MSEKKGADAALVKPERAGALGVGMPAAPRTLQGWTQKGRVPHQRLGGRIAFSEDELRAFAQAGHHGLDEMGGAS
ncbi:MAG: helix-turn-helix domain-containing protein [Spirochaetia bacterium]|jgi:hypothetical protein